MSKSRQIYHPERGDICLLDWDPQKGLEQAKRRPVLVISDGQFNKKMGLAFVCPITSTPARHGFHIKLDQDVKTKGVVMIEQQKSLDYVSRHATYAEKAPDSLLTIVSDIIKQIIDDPQQ